MSQVSNGCHREVLLFGGEPWGPRELETSTCHIQRQAAEKMNYDDRWQQSKKENVLHGKKWSLRTVLIVSHSFGHAGFSFSFLVSLLTHWPFSPELFSSHEFEHFLLVLLISIFNSRWWDRVQGVISVFFHNDGHLFIPYLWLIFGESSMSH